MWGGGGRRGVWSLIFFFGVFTPPSAGGERSSGGACVSRPELAVPQGAGGVGKRSRAGPMNRSEL